MAVGPYGGENTPVFVSGTDGQIEDFTSLAYPSAYLEVFVLYYVQLRDPGLRCREPDLGSLLIGIFPVAFEGLTVLDEYCTLEVSLVTLSKPYVESLSISPFTMPDAWVGNQNIHESFIAWFASTTNMFNTSSLNPHCSILAAGLGPPILKIPASAITTTISTTVQGTAPPPSKVAAPASPVRSVMISSTAAAKSPSVLRMPQPSSSSLASVPPHNDVPLIGPILPPKPQPSLTASSQWTFKPAYHVESSLGGHLPPQSQHDTGSTLVPTVPTVPQPRPLASPGSASVLSHRLSSLGKPAAQAGAHTVPKSTPMPKDFQPDATSTVQAQTFSTPHDIFASSVAQGIANGGYVVIDSSSTKVALPIKHGNIIIGGSIYTANSVGDFVVDDQTFTPGKTTAIFSTPVSYSTAQSDSISSITQNPGPQTTQKPIFIFGDTIYTANSLNDFNVDGETLLPGQALTISGTPISYGTTNGKYIMIGSTTQSFTPMTTKMPTFTLNNTVYTANSLGDFIIDGETLIPGQALTISGTPVFYVTTNGDYIAVGSSTQSLAVIMTTAVAYITLGGSTYTENPASAFVIDGKTLTRGGDITVDGTPISYLLAGTEEKVVVGSSTEAVKTSTESSGLGNFIMGGLGNGPDVASTACDVTSTKLGNNSSGWSIMNDSRRAKTGSGEMSQRGFLIVITLLTAWYRG